MDGRTDDDDGANDCQADADDGRTTTGRMTDGRTDGRTENDLFENHHMSFIEFEQGPIYEPQSSLWPPA